jgi:hypothetical protein
MEQVAVGAPVRRGRGAARTAPRRGISGGAAGWLGGPPSPPSIPAPPLPTRSSTTIPSEEQGPATVSLLPPAAAEIQPRPVHRRRRSSLCAIPLPGGRAPCGVSGCARWQRTLPCSGGAGIRTVAEELHDGSRALSLVGEAKLSARRWRSLLAPLRDAEALATGEELDNAWCGREERALRMTAVGILVKAEGSFAKSTQPTRSGPLEGAI